MEWSRLLLGDVFLVNHRHVVFTIDEGLWSVFLLHRKMLKEFMDEAVRIIKEHFEKKHKITPSIIAGLNTFGSVEHIVEEAARATNRKEYQKVCQIIRQLIKANGTAHAEKLIQQFRLVYPNRPAFMDELQKIKS